MMFACGSQAFPSSSFVAWVWVHLFTPHVEEIHQCCVVHDAAYDACADQRMADDALHACLSDVETTTGLYQWMVADGFFWLVRAFGQSAYCAPDL